MSSYVNLYYFYINLNIITLTDPNLFNRQGSHSQNIFIIKYIYIHILFQRFAWKMIFPTLIWRNRVSTRSLLFAQPTRHDRRKGGMIDRARKVSLWRCWSLAGVITHNCYIMDTRRTNKRRSTRSDETRGTAGRQEGDGWKVCKTPPVPYNRQH